jgi:hypothetical protein
MDFSRWEKHVKNNKSLDTSKVKKVPDVIIRV